MPLRLPLGRRPDGGSHARSTTAGVLVALVVLLSAAANSAATSGGSEAPASVGEQLVMQEAIDSLSGGGGPAGGAAVSCAGTVSASLQCQSPVAASASVPLSYPTHRWGAEITYDASDGYPLLYGGQNDTWAFENGYWVNLHPKVIPPISSFACLAYDWKDRYVVLYGGGRGGIGTPTIDRNQTWTYHAGKWTNVTNPTDSPPGLQYPSCAYDAAPGAGYVLMFGGAESEGPTHTGASYLTIHSSNQTWEFSGGRWTNVTNYSAAHPSARFGASMVYDDVDGYVLLYGGAVNGTSTANGSCTPRECPHLNDTWKFSGGRWTNISASASTNGTPPGRWEAGIANDTAAGAVVIFGGQANGYKSYNATGNYTWEFSGGTWKNVTGSLSLSPETRFGEAMGYDPSTRSILMFSGLNCTRSAILWPQTWTFRGGSWQLLSYFLNFTETGLPSGTPWNVSLTPEFGSGFVVSTNGSEIELGWTTGNYSYAIGAVTGYDLSSGASTGTVSVESSSVSLGFSPSSYTVRFIEHGLRTAWDTKWTVTLDGRKRSTTKTSLSFTSLTPGTYSYTVTRLSNYSLNRSYSGSITVSLGGPTKVAAVVDLKWTLITYRVTFHETGLPALTDWTVSIDGRQKSTDGASLSFSLSNGTYAFSASASGYLGKPSGGNLTIDGAARSQKISFAAGDPRVSFLSVPGFGGSPRNRPGDGSG